MIQHLTHSRKNTPWAEETMSVLQRYLTYVTLRNYYNKHPNQSIEIKEVKEADVFNSFPVTKCRFCDSQNIQKYGYNAKGLRRYYCKNCHNYFLVTTNTIFDSHKLPLSEWVDFCIGVFGNLSFNGISKLNRNSPSTTSY